MLEEGKERKRRTGRQEGRKREQRGKKGSRNTGMLGGREGKAGQYLQRKASEKMGINYSCKPTKIKFIKRDWS